MAVPSSESDGAMGTVFEPIVIESSDEGEGDSGGEEEGESRGEEEGESGGEEEGESGGEDFQVRVELSDEEVCIRISI